MPGIHRQATRDELGRLFERPGLSVDGDDRDDEPISGEVTAVEPPLRVPRTGQRDVAIAQVLLQYAALLERYVVRWPEQLRPRAVRFAPG